MTICIRCNASFRCGMVDSTEEPCFDIGHAYEVTARSLLLFQLA